MPPLGQGARERVRAQRLTARHLGPGLLVSFSSLRSGNQLMGGENWPDSSPIWAAGGQAG